MPRNRLTFRQRDITAAIRAAEAAGQKVARIEITHDGGFTILLGEPIAGAAREDAATAEYLKRLRED